MVDLPLEDEVGVDLAEAGDVVADIDVGEY